jgi:hypothetical protein
VSAEGAEGTVSAVNARLERRYRWLLTCYPAPYRRVYEDEILGVLMTSSGQRQRFPGLGDTLDLIRSAASIRLGRFGAGFADRRWADAAAVFGVLAPMLLFAHRIFSFLGGYLWSARLHEALPDHFNRNGLTLSFWGPAVAWAAVTVAALLGWRVVAAVGAWLTVLAESLALGTRYSIAPVEVLHWMWLLVFGVTAAAALTVRTTSRRAVEILGWPKTIVFAVASVLFALSSAIDPLTVRITAYPNGYSTNSWPADVHLPYLLAGGLLTLILYAIVGIAMLVVFLRIDASIRSRVLVLLAPTVALIGLISLSFTGFADSSVRFAPPVLLVPAQWALLALTPLVTFLCGVLLVNWRERRLRLIRLGEAVERRNESA